MITVNDIILILLSIAAVSFIGMLLIKSSNKRKVKKYKLALDIHGVSDTWPEFFSTLSQMFMSAGHEVHILTGVEWTDEVRILLAKHNIIYSHRFSVIDYHKEIGTPIKKNERKELVIDDGEMWDRTKAEYCAKHGISWCIDDSPHYGKHFTTPYMKVSIEKK